MKPHLKSQIPNPARRGSIAPSAASRRGLSLLEVLFAIFIAAVGLLGLAALLTVGGVQTAQSEQADRSAAFARDALRQVENRNMLRPFVGSFRSGPMETNYFNWLDVNGAPWPNPPDVPNPINPTQVDDTHGQRVPPFVIDPLFISRHYDGTGGTRAPKLFPYFVDPTASGSLPGLQLPRITLAGIYSNTQGAMTAAADRVFTCHDDLLFQQPDRLQRPSMMVGADGTPSIAGDYSYLVMVTPADSENPITNPNPPPQYTKAVALDQRRLFTVQIVVFYKRLLGVDATAASSTTALSERQMLASVMPGQTVQNIRIAPSDAAYLKGLAANQWILLSAYLNPPQDEPSLKRPLHRWARIVSIGKVQGSSAVTINVAGAEWNTLQTTTPGQCVATIVDNIIGVYERTVELDTRSLTSPEGN